MIAGIVPTERKRYNPWHAAAEEEGGLALSLCGRTIEIDHDAYGEPLRALLAEPLIDGPDWQVVECLTCRRAMTRLARLTKEEAR